MNSSRYHKYCYTNIHSTTQCQPFSIGQLLKNINVERDMQKKREVIKKVIAYMTLGIDVSRLFSDMIMVIA